MKKAKDLERIVKGCANHHRIDVLILLGKEPELTLDEISDRLSMNFKTASEHVRRMALAGLLMKRYEGSSVHHKLTSRGKNILKFLRILE